MMKWMYIVMLVVALGFSGCAKDATAEDSAVTTTTEKQNEARTDLASGDTTWIAIVMTWNPVVYTIDK